jgi:hypothetical protein
VRGRREKPGREWVCIRMVPRSSLSSDNLNKMLLAMAAHSGNPRNLGGRGKEGSKFEASLGKVSGFYLKNPKYKKGWEHGSK